MSKGLVSGSALKSVGRMVMGRLQDLLLDIAKNLVSMILQGRGSRAWASTLRPRRFVGAPNQHRPEVVALPALLTSTMPTMRTTVEALDAAGMCHRVKIIIGGAPLIQDHGNEIGGDRYAPEGKSAVRKIKELLEMLRAEHGLATSTSGCRPGLSSCVGVCGRAIGGCAQNPRAS